MSFGHGEWVGRRDVASRGFVVLEDKFSPPQNEFRKLFQSIFFPHRSTFDVSAEIVCFESLSFPELARLLSPTFSPLNGNVLKCTSSDAIFPQERPLFLNSAIASPRQILLRRFLEICPPAPLSSPPPKGFAGQDPLTF